RNEGAGPAFPPKNQRSAEAVEAEPDGRQILFPLVRLLTGARCDVRGNQPPAHALVRAAERRQEAGPPERHQAHSVPNPVQEDQTRQGSPWEALAQTSL